MVNKKTLGYAQQSSRQSMLSSQLNHNVGYLLTKAREEQKLSIDEVVSILKVRRHIIDTIENDGYTDQRIDVYFRGHIVAYCRLLNLNHKNILNNLEAKGYDLYQQEPAKTKPKSERSYSPKLILPLASICIMITIYNYIPDSSPQQRTSVTKPFIQHNESPYV